MRRHVKGYAVISLLVHSCAFGKIYRCELNNKIGFQQTPCPVMYAENIIEESKLSSKLQSISIETSALVTQPTLNPKETLVLKRNIDGHFHLEALVNGIKVNFLIDTGATMVAITEEVAKEAQLIKQEDFIVETAEGSSTSQAALVKEFKIGAATFKNINVMIIKGHTALLGMNVLSQYDINQKDDVLSLTPKPTN